MKFNFKTSVLPLVLLTVLSQTACVDPETKQLKANQDCQTSKEETYKFSFIGFLDPKKVTFREIANDKFLYEKTIGLNDIRLNSYGFGTDLNLIDAKNKNYYQVIIDDRYLFTLSEINIYAIVRHVKFSDYIFCEIHDLNVNGKKRRISDYGYHLEIDKKDAIILPVANSKK